MNEIYLIVMYYPGDKDAGKDVQTWRGYFTDKFKAETLAHDLNRNNLEERYLVRPVEPA